MKLLMEVKTSYNISDQIENVLINHFIDIYIGRGRDIWFIDNLD